MMGKDIENIISQIEKVKSSLIELLSFKNDLYKIEPLKKGLKSIQTDIVEDTKPVWMEKVHDDWQTDRTNNWNEFKTAMDKSRPTFEKLMSVEGKMYTSASKFNNSIGSPWIEFRNMLKLYDFIDEKNQEPEMTVHDFIELYTLYGVLYSQLNDCKFAIITYNDYIQRGYDTIFNGNIPSITINRNKGTKTTGNVSQTIDNNVSIPKQSIDPY